MANSDKILNINLDVILPTSSASVLQESDIACYRAHELKYLRDEYLNDGQRLCLCDFRKTSFLVFSSLRDGRREVTSYKF